MKRFRCLSLSAVFLPPDITLLCHSDAGVHFASSKASQGPWAPHPIFVGVGSSLTLPGYRRAKFGVLDARSFVWISVTVQFPDVDDLQYGIGHTQNTYEGRKNSKYNVKGSSSSPTEQLRLPSELGISL